LGLRKVLGLVGMNFFEAVVNWRPTTKFEKRHVDDKMIGVMLHMATHAPSAGNIQEWEFVVVRDEDVKKKLAKAALEQMHVAEAPVVIVVLSDLEKISLKYGKRGELVYALEDTAAATMLLLLSAEALGLGADWVKSFDEDAVKTAVELPDTVRPIAIVPVGFPREKSAERRLLDFEAFTWADRYKRKYDWSYRVQIGPKETYKEFRPIGNVIEDMLKKRIKERKKKAGTERTEKTEKTEKWVS